MLLLILNKGHPTTLTFWTKRWYANGTLAWKRGTKLSPKLATQGQFAPKHTCGLLCPWRGAILLVAQAKHPPRPSTRKENELRALKWHSQPRTFHSSAIAHLVLVPNSCWGHPPSRFPPAIMVRRNFQYSPFVSLYDKKLLLKSFVYDEVNQHHPDAMCHNKSLNGKAQSSHHLIDTLTDLSRTLTV